MNKYEIKSQTYKKYEKKYQLKIYSAATGTNLYKFCIHINKLYDVINSFYVSLASS